MGVKKYRGRRFRRYERRKKRRSRAFSVLSVLVVLAGVGLLGYAFLGGGDSALLNIFSASSKEEEVAEIAAKSTTLKLTVPEMARVEDLPVYNTAWDDESALEASAQHVDSTGFPWEDEANVFIAGHRMGYPGTDSFLVFYDLDVLEEGDEIFLTDSEGTRYTYTVYENFVTDPYDWSVTEPVPGKNNVVTLQTCTLPDYSDRIIIHAELTEVEQSAEEAEPLPDEPEKEAAPDEQYSDAPFPVEPFPEASLPVEPIPDEPILDEPLPVDPITGDLIPEDQAPIEPFPPGPAQGSEPLPADTALPVEPAPVEPVPDGQAPVF